MTHAAPSEPDDPTRLARMALDSVKGYYSASCESASTDVQYAQMVALQGILRAMIYAIEADLESVQSE